MAQLESYSIDSLALARMGISPQQLFGTAELPLPSPVLPGLTDFADGRRGIMPILGEYWHISERLVTQVRGRTEPAGPTKGRALVPSLEGSTERGVAGV